MELPARIARRLSNDFLSSAARSQGRIKRSVNLQHRSRRCAVPVLPAIHRRKGDAKKVGHGLLGESQRRANFYKAGRFKHALMLGPAHLAVKRFL